MLERSPKYGYFSEPDRSFKVGNVSTGKNMAKFEWTASVTVCTQCKERGIWGKISEVSYFNDFRLFRIRKPERHLLN